MRLTQRGLASVRESCPPQTMPTLGEDSGNTGKVSVKLGLADPNRAGPHQGSSIQEVRKWVMYSVFSSNGVATCPHGLSCLWKEPEWAMGREPGTASGSQTRVGTGIVGLGEPTQQQGHSIWH